MKPESFIASNAEEAVAQIRSRLGPNAVVLDVRPLPPNGIARFWQKPLIEVLAHVPGEEPAAAMEPVAGVIEEFRNELSEIRRHVVSMPATVDVPAPETAAARLPALEAATEIFPETVKIKCGRWRSGELLQKSGMLPLYAQHLLDDLATEHGPNPPAALADELALVRGHLARYWHRSKPVTGHSMNVLVGPHGSGKTSSLCKWLTQAVLVEGRRARVWRLDATTANMAESLSVYCEILGVSCERMWNNDGGSPFTQPGFSEFAGFIDLPGVDWRQPLAVRELAGLLKRLGSPRVHLVLNGAYDASLLMSQVRAFAPLNVEDLIITHLDEETRWGKLWNLAMGTSFPIRHLGTGQNVPGDYLEASAEKILARQFPCK